MTNFASTISVGVRTGDALTQLKALQAELAKTTTAAQQLAAASARRPSHGLGKGMDVEARNLAQALKTTARDIEQSSRSVQGSYKQITEGHRGMARAAPNSTTAIKAHTTAMRDAHAVARGLSGSLGALWMTYGNLAPLLTAAAIGTTMRSTYQVGKDLEYRLSFVEALGNRPINPEEMMPQVLGSMKTPLEAAEALQALAQAGMNADQSLAALGATMRLSTLGELGMTEAAIAMTGTISAFQLSAEEAGRVGDVFAKAAATSNTSVAKITESMRQASTAAAQYNISVEEVSAALAVMAQRNIVGSMAGTSYRNMLKELYTPIARGAKAMEQLGISAYNADKSMKPLSEVLVEVRDRMAGMDEQSRNTALEAIFGERGGRSIRPILADLEAYLDKIKEMEDATGFLAEANTKLIDTVEGASNRLQSTVQQSYSKAFEGVKGNVKDLLLALDSVAASEGFVSAIQTGTNVLIAFGEASVRSGRVIMTAAAAYLAIRASIAAVTTVTTLATAAKEIRTRFTERSTQAITAETAALQANTAAQSTNNATTASGTLTQTARAATSAASGVGAIMGVLSRLTPVLGWVTLGYVAVNAVMDSYNKRANTASMAADNLIKRNEDHARTLKNLADEAENAYERMRQDVTSDDLLEDNLNQMTASQRQDLETVKASVEAEKSRKQELQEQVVRLQEQRQEHQKIIETTWRNAKAREAVSIIDGQIRDLNQQIEFTKDNILTLEGKQAEAAAKSAEAEANKLRLMEAQEKIRSRNLGSRLLQPFEYADEQYRQLEAKRQAGTASARELKLLDQLAKETQGGRSAQRYQSFIDSAIDASGGLTTEDDLWLRTQAELAFKGSRGLTESFSLAGSGGGGSGSREFISNASLIKQQYDREKSMFASIRDMQIKGIRDLEAVGRYSTEEAAQKRREIWQTYVEDTAAAAAVAADKIRAVDPGSDYLKELSAQGVLRDAEHQMVLAQFEERKRIAEEAIRIEVEAERARINLAGDLGKIREKIAQDEKKQAFERSKQYMTEAEISGIEARERAEREYNREIAKQIENWEKLVALKKGDVAAAHSDPTGQNIQYTLTELQKAQADAGAKAYAQGVSNYMRDQTIAAGAQRAFTHYQNEALKTGDVIERAFIDTFDAMGSGLAEMVATGKADFRSLTVSVLENLAKMATQAALNPLFGMLVRVGTSLIGGSAAPAGVTPGVDWTHSAKGNVFTAGQVQKFAKGGVFTNQIVSQPTLAPMALFGEVPGESEAIMPLARTSSGHLGVRALPVGSQGAGGGNVFYMTTNVHVDADGNTTSNTQADENLLSQFGNQLNNQIKDVIKRETGQGGLIRRAIQGA